MNAQPNVIALQPTDVLARLVEDLRRAKANEQAAKLARLEAEEALLAHPAVARELKDEGTITVGDAVKVTTKLSRSWDQAQLVAISKQIDSAWFPFKTEYKEDRKASRVVEERFPALWDELRQALTLKPAKPSVSLVGGEAE
jgi:hypothetical protein